MNHKLETEIMEAESDTEAIAKLDKKLKAMHVSFVIYTAREE